MTFSDYLDKDGFYLFLALATLIVIAAAAFRGEW